MINHLALATERKRKLSNRNANERSLTLLSPALKQAAERCSDHREVKSVDCGLMRVLSHTKNTLF
jgi:hypothetical protein